MQETHDAQSSLFREKLEKWNRWLKIIYEDITEQAASRSVFKESMEIIRGNPDIPQDSDFFDFIEKWYAESITMGLRRQIKVDKTSISLVRLLEDIAANSCLLSRVHFVTLHSLGLHDFAHKTFDDHVGVGALHVDSGTVQAEIQKLRNLANSCETYADRHVAHHDPRGVSTLPTYKELNEAIDFTEYLVQRYYLLLRAESIVSIKPTFGSPWKKIFEIPWAPP